MESTKFLRGLDELMEQYSEPTSLMQVARDAVMRQVAAKNKVEMPVILDEAQRKVFMDNIKHLAGFLESDDGADAVELLVNAYKHYCDRVESEKEEDD